VRLRGAGRQALANADAHEQLAASRARIVEAGDAERRRLERNLHDGAQQRLVSLALDLRLIGATLEKDPPAPAATSTRRQEQLAQGSTSCASWRAASIRRSSPTAASARRSRRWRARAGAGRDHRAADERLAGPVEAAAYYVVAEAITNVAKYAQRLARHRQRPPLERQRHGRRSPTTASAARTPPRHRPARAGGPPRGARRSARGRQPGRERPPRARHLASAPRFPYPE
jgi:hypothetical protein